MNKKVDRSKNIYVYDMHIANYLVLNGGIVTGIGVHKITNRVFVAFDYDSTRQAFAKFDREKKNS